LWEETPAGAVTVNPFTNSTAGTILGSNVDGNISANVDGTGSVAGWSTLVGLVNTKGEGDMKKSTYDTNNNGIVDNSEKVNNHTVNDNVPANVFSGQATGTVSGTELTISDPIIIDNIELNGDTEQQTYTGKNLFDVNEQVVSQNNSTYTIIDGTITVTQTDANQNNALIGIKIPNSENLLGKTINISLNAQSYAGATGGRIILWDNTTTTAYLSLNNPDDQGNMSGSVTLPNSFPGTSTFFVLYIYTNKQNAGGSLGGYTVFTNVQIKVGSTKTSFEPYVGGTASPNPDYPQEVQTVTGRQVVTVAGKNLFDKDKPLENRYIDANGNWVTGGGYSYVNQEIATTGGEKITLSFSQQVGSGNIRFAQYKNDGTFIQRGLFNTSPTTITLQANTAKVIWSVDNTSSLYFENLQIERSASATPYVPYNTQTYEVNLGKNLFDKDNANTLNAYINGGTPHTIAIAGSNTSVYIPCQPNTTYTISKVADTVFRAGTTAETPASGVVVNDYVDNYGGSTITITSSSNAKYIVVFLMNNSSSHTQADLLASLQIEKGSTATSYAPYFTPIELCKISDYQDYIYKSGDDWYIHKETAKMILDGTETITKPFTNIFVIENLSGNWPKMSETVFYFCEKYYPLKAINNNSSFNTLAANYGYAFNFTNTAGGNNIRFKDTRYDNIDNYKTWLASNNVTVYYALATPTDTQITDENLIGQLNDLEGAGLSDTTEITVDGSLPAILNVTYFNKNLNGICGVIRKLAANS
jgi:hypothetical protein